MFHIRAARANGDMSLAENQIKIKKIKLKELASWAANLPNHPAFQKVVPISLTRAVSQSKNPCGRPEDVALFVAFNADQCVGYHGLLPAVLKQGHRLSRVHWATTFFVAPDFRRKGIGKYLLQEIKNSKIDFVVCQITESARRAYRSAGLKDLGQLTYFQLRVDRLDFVPRFFDATADRLRRQGPRTLSGRLGIIGWLQRPIYRLAKRLFYRAATRRSDHRPERKFSWKIVDRIDPTLFGESNRQLTGATFFREIETINWMLSYPWVISGHPRKADMPRYYFSDVRDLFRYVAIEINSVPRGGPLGFLVLSISDKREKTRVKILDFHFNNPADDEIAVYLALKHAAIYLADRIEYPDSLAVYFNRRAEFRKLIKKQNRLYMFGPRSSDSPLAACSAKIAFDYCDGDTSLA